GGRVRAAEPLHHPLPLVCRAHGMENQLARPQLVVTHQRPIVESQPCGGGCVCGGGLGWGQTTISLRSWSDPIFLAEVVGEVAEEAAGERYVGVSRHLGAWQGGQAAAGAVEEICGAFLML